MIAKRYLLAALGVSGSLATLIACSDSLESSREVTGPAASVQAASVRIEVSDIRGQKMGTCAGVLIAPRLALTAAHCVAGKSKWSVSTNAGGRAEGLRGYTYDFKSSNNCQIDARKHDVAVLHLDKPINLPAYPALASQTDLGQSVQRVATQSMDLRPGNVHKIAGWPLSYGVRMDEGESLLTGGAVFNRDGRIVGVVSGRGMRTGNLYVARVDGMLNWLSRKLTCGGKVATQDLGILCSGSGSKGGTCTKTDAGSGSGTSSSSSGSGGTGSSGGADGGTGSSGSSGGSSGSSGGSSGGGTGGSSGSSGSSGGGGSDDCSTGGGNCSGSCPGGAGGDGDSSSMPGGAGGTGGSTTSSGGTVGSSSGSSGAGGTGGSTTSSGGTVGSSSGSSGAGSGSTQAGGGAKGSSGTATSSGGTIGSTPGPVGGGAGGVDENCSAPSSCVDDGDDLIDFGDSAGCKPEKGGTAPVLR